MTEEDRDMRKKARQQLLEIGTSGPLSVPEARGMEHRLKALQILLQSYEEQGR